MQVLEIKNDEDEFIILLAGIVSLRSQMALCSDESQLFDVMERYLTIVDCLIKIAFKIYNRRHRDINDYNKSKAI